MKRTTMRLWSLTVVTAAVILSAGCSSHAPRSQTPTADTHVSTPTSAASADPKPSTSPSGPAESSAGSVPAITVVPARFSGGFTTPTGNIQCSFGGGGVWCSVKDKPWKQKPVTAECRGSEDLWDTTIQMDDTESRAHFRGDCYPIPDADGPTLAYGHALQAGKMRCASMTDGLDCVVVGTQRGFFISRSRYLMHARRTPLTIAPTPVRAPGPDTVVPVGFHGGFVTPSRGIACDIDASVVNCIVLEPTSWKAPPYGKRCDYDEAAQFAVHAGQPGKAFTTCRSDSLGGGPPLPYGHTLRIGAMRCTSERTGLTCIDTRSGHGVTVSREHFRGY